MFLIIYSQKAVRHNRNQPVDLAHCEGKNRPSGLLLQRLSGHCDPPISQCVRRARWRPVGRVRRGTVAAARPAQNSGRGAPGLWSRDLVGQSAAQPRSPQHSTPR